MAANKRKARKLVSITQLMKAEGARAELIAGLVRTCELVQKEEWDRAYEVISKCEKLIKALADANISTLDLVTSTPRDRPGSVSRRFARFQRVAEEAKKGTGGGGQGQ